MELDTEQKAIRQMDSNKKAILDASNLMDEMAALRSRLHIRDGSGQRYLQKTKPEQGDLQQAEKEIISQYAGSSDQTSASSAKKSKLLRNIARKGTI